MTLEGSIAYQVGKDIEQLFAAPGNVVTLFNDGPALVYLSTASRFQVGAAIPLPTGASTQWDGDKPCYAATAVTGASATIRTTDNSGAINDPSALASAIIAQGLAGQIASAISLAPAQPIPVIFDAFAYPTHVALTTILPDTYVDGELQPAGPYTVPAGYRLVLTGIDVKGLNTAIAAVAMNVRMRSTITGRTFGFARLRLGAGLAGSCFIPLAAAVSIPHLWIPLTDGLTWRDETGAVGITADITAYGGLYPI